MSIRSPSGKGPFLDGHELSVGHKGAQFPHVAFVDQMGLAQPSFPFRGFLGQNVVAMGFGKSKFSAARFPKAFGGGPIGFNLWHDVTPCDYNAYTGSEGRLPAAGRRLEPGSYQI